MALASTLAVAAATTGIKKIVDDVYANIKERGTIMLGKARSEVKDLAIAKALLTVTKVKTLWNIDKEVSLYDFYYPSTVEFSDEIKKRINGIRDFGPSGHFIIQGTAGQGKSIFLRFLCGQELRAEQTSGRVPIFIELRRIRSDLTLNDLILQGLERYKLPATQSAWNVLAESGKFVLLLDAFDEIDPALSDRTIADIETIICSFREKLQILITSRPDADIQKSNQFRVFKLSQLTPADHSPFLRKICFDKEQAESLMMVLKASSTDVSGLLTTPLMMTLLVILYKSSQTIPDTVPKFYEELFDVLFYRHDHSKPGFRRKRFTQLDDGSVKRLFSALCFFVRLHGLGVMSNQQMHDCCEQASLACSQPIDPEKFKAEMVKTICLMQEEGFEISFIHKSVAQYYAASFVSKSSEGFAKTFYDLAIKQTGWELELKFLSQIDTYRFNKLFELPLLLQIASEIGISIEVIEPTDAEKVSTYFIENMAVVALVPKNKNVSKLSGNFVGWSIRDGTPGASQNRDVATKEFSTKWMQPVLSCLEKSKAPLPPRKYDEGNHQFIQLNHYLPIIKQTSVDSGKQILDSVRDRYKKALEIIDSEGRKTAMLSAFMLQRSIDATKELKG